MRARLLPGVILLVLATVPAAAIPLPQPGEIAARRLVAAPVSCQTFVFDGTEYPAVRLDVPAGAAPAAGPTTSRLVMFRVDPARIPGWGWQRQPDPAPTAPGVYMGSLQLTADGRPFAYRLITLYRTPKKVDPAWTFDPANPEELAALAGVDRGLVERQTKLIAGVCRDRPFAQLAADPRFARLLAGLALMPKDGGPVTKQNDAFAYERQAWVSGGAVRAKHGPANPLPRPALVNGPPAPVVHEGSEADAGMKPGTVAKIDAVLTEWAGEDDQAFAVCAVRKGVVVLHKAYGTRDGKVMTVDTPSWMASVTKTMSATCMLMLVDAGLVGLDDPPAAFLPGLPEKNAAGRRLLVRHLYTHTSGLAEWPPDLYRDEHPDIEYRARLALPHLRIGNGFVYGGQGYALGGKVIENVSGEAMPLFYKRHLLDPLGMTRTEVTGTHADAYSTPLDMAKFGQMLLNRGAYGPHRFMSPETFALMLPRTLTEELGPDATKTFGFGLDGQPNRFGHGAASGATFSVDVDNELVVVMTRNKYGSKQDRFNGKFWDAIKAGIVK